jgi:hypothetical protein
MIALLGVLIASVNGTVYNLTNVGAPTFNRTYAQSQNDLETQAYVAYQYEYKPTSLSPGGVNYLYANVTIPITAAGTYNVSFISASAANVFLFIYEGSFDPSNALTNVLSGIYGKS